MRYALVVLQTLALPDDGAKTGEIGGPLESRGAIEVIREHGFVDLTGKTFTLITDDERCLKAWAKSGDPVSGLWEIAGSGPQGLEP